MNKTAIYFLALIAGCIGLMIIAGRLVADKEVPSLSDFLASSTAALASSTAELASSTSQVSAPAATTLLTVDVSTSRGDIHAMIAADEASRERGLSYRASLPADAGMLFVFDEPGQYGFWMKDMNFPLDMVWIGADKTVLGVTKDISSSTYPETFSPPSPVLYVLEINADAAARFGLATGTPVRFDLPAR